MRRRILLWHVHGSWTTSFVQGGHDYVVPVDAARGPDGRGLARTWDWLANVTEVYPEQFGAHDFGVHDVDAQDIDAVILQRPHEADLVASWLGRRPGLDLPAIYLEHNTPGGNVPATRHPYADQDRIPIVQVTAFNRLFWDCGSVRTEVIDHGIIDPGHRYLGDLPRAAVVINDPIQRARAVGTDLLTGAVRGGPARCVRHGCRRRWSRWPRPRCHRRPARGRCDQYSPGGAGRGGQSFLYRPSEARRVGAAGREAALSRYGLNRFLGDWDRLLAEVVPGRPGFIDLAIAVN
ncbi:hypothetical protein BH24ACT9_BH24ACT9_00790 [soil metagenome]